MANVAEQQHVERDCFEGDGRACDSFEGCCAELEASMGDASGFRKVLGMMQDDLPSPARFLPDPYPFPGGKLSERVFCVRQGNAFPMTHTGTNTYIASDPASGLAYVIDPGSVDPQHLDDIQAALCGLGVRAVAVITTHGHFDHSGQAQLCATRLGVPWYSAEDGTLRAGEFVVCEGAPVLQAIAMPGHSSDSMCLLFPADGSCFTGDVVFRHGPTVVFYPDGNLACYLDSLDALQQLAETGKAAVIYPAHGWPFSEPAYFVQATRAHREERLAQIEEALGMGVAATPEALADSVYADVSGALRMATLKSIQAQLEYLGLDPEA